MNPNKSFLLLSPQGHKAYSWARVFFAQAKPHVWVPQGDFSVAVVRRNKSLGTLLQDNGSMGPEIVARSIAMTGALGPLRRAIGKNPQLPMAKR